MKILNFDGGGVTDVVGVTLNVDGDYVLDNEEGLCARHIHVSDYVAAASPAFAVDDDFPNAQYLYIALLGYKAGCTPLGATTCGFLGISYSKLFNTFEEYEDFLCSSQILTGSVSGDWLVGEGDSPVSYSFDWELTW